MPIPPFKIALVHDWLTGMRGGEYVLEAVAELFPDAELFTMLHVPGSISSRLANLKRHTSPLQKVPGIGRRYRKFLPLMPFLIERFDLSGFELIISTSHCVAKGVRKPENAVHVSYIFAPMRYIWDRYEDYFGPGRSSWANRTAARLLRPFLRKWDIRTGSRERIDVVLGISRYISDQIESYYGREARVVPAFGDIARFLGRERRPGPRYLIVSAFAPYKRVDLAIEAFNRLKLPLTIVGSGQDETSLRAAAGPTIEFKGSLSNEAIAELYAGCRAFVFPGQEDFGITPIEANASGAPVIAFGAGGALETMTGKTCVFFAPQTVDALMEAVLKFERGEAVIREEDCRAQAALFTKARFQQGILEAVRSAWREAGKDPEALEKRITGI